MLLALHELHELLSNLACFGVSSNHSHPRAGIVAVQIGPHLAEGFLEVLSFDDERQLESGGFWAVFEVGQEVD